MSKMKQNHDSISHALAAVTETWLQPGKGCGKGAAEGEEGGLKPHCPAKAKPALALASGACLCADPRLT